MAKEENIKGSLSELQAETARLMQTLTWPDALRTASPATKDVLTGLQEAAGRVAEALSRPGLASILIPEQQSGRMYAASLSPNTRPLPSVPFPHPMALPMPLPAPLRIRADPCQTDHYSHPSRHGDPLQDLASHWDSTMPLGQRLRQEAVILLEDLKDKALKGRRNSTSHPIPSLSWEEEETLAVTENLIKDLQSFGSPYD
mmetsp:Transcript_31600/g.50995  ORF Transcript_31600/g.50995 Transcript_31600/m.50995 type:complete len:201 (-) Transcript_31600:275-877(-)|eukprot:CAMPEP_0184659586 /NCGR_PEP_ID=MMETSP0308-20130426/30245_1 /TAXON_ID=38269 /ORGANISM="Gloeochaete witrockiana, Strain SAG 46.84" /LENGTH=200 /DNA_ID=CAMNT_0027099521 /DNA_START=17 /DNA_END=619 /DNA_ORIENTATION=+